MLFPGSGAAYVPLSASYKSLCLLTRDGLETDGAMSTNSFFPLMSRLMGLPIVGVETLCRVVGLSPELSVVGTRMIGVDGTNVAGGSTGSTEGVYGSCTIRFVLLGVCAVSACSWLLFAEEDVLVGIVGCCS